MPKHATLLELLMLQSGLPIQLEGFILTQASLLCEIEMLEVTWLNAHQ